jgi:Nif-specific regulatory protein
MIAAITSDMLCGATRVASALSGQRAFHFEMPERPLSFSDVNPRLIALNGSFMGTAFPLEGEVSIGRESANTICLSEASISRRHCLLKSEDSQFTIVDLDSFNGTFVNGIPVKQQNLAHGDQIAIGRILFLFLLYETETVSSEVVQLEDLHLTEGSTVKLSQERARYLHPDLISGLRPSPRVVRDLNALLKISTTINSIRELSELQKRLLELIIEVIPAERGAILLYDEQNDDVTSVCGLDRALGFDTAMSVSRTITQQVMRERLAVLSNDVFDDPAAATPESLITSQVHAVLCVPVLSFGKSLGVVYLDTSHSKSFDEDHLQLLTAIAGIAAIAFSNAQHVQWLEDEKERLQEQIELKHRMIGESSAMKRLYERIARIAPADSTVLIRGESGTGKELAAHAIHSNSPRAQEPFIAINCATLSDTLLESELFGHERGSFTGAIAQKVGKFEVAHRGTMFLDEVGELSPAIQAKLLRVLQEQKFERVGGTRPITVDVRIIAATNRDLEEAIKAKTFRQDLYYRLNVVTLTVPPLRERRDDIPLLGKYFAAEHAKKCKRRLKGISAETAALLQAYPWPGNVREFENAIEHAVVIGTTEIITPEDLPEVIYETGEVEAMQTTRYHEAVKEAKKRVVLIALEEAKWNYTEAAHLLGIHPNNLHRLIRNLHLKSASK